jgi:hypothetical protein
MCRREIPIDECALTIHPAAAVTNEANEHVMYQGLYYLVLSDRDGQEQRTSAKNYGLSDACQLAERLLGRPRERALLLWDSSPP